MFGIGPTELVVIGLLFMVIFGPSKFVSMAHEVGRFVTNARDSAEEFKSELTSEEDGEARSALEGLKSEASSDTTPPPQGDEASHTSKQKPPTEDKRTGDALDS
jgi:Sec-independent protein translocase protein TatA